jgi:pheromone shutdown-related protein TraB
MAEQLGIKPGAELMAAVKKAEEVDAELVLADRDVQITLKRTWGNLSFFDKMNVLGGLVMSLFYQEEIKEEDLESLKEKANLSRMLQEFAEAAPSIKEPLIDERDKFLISSIEEAPGETIVAVVGAGHVEGMVKHFGESIQRETLNELPAKGPWGKILKWVIPAIVIAMFFFGYQKSATKFDTLQQMLTAWILPNAIFCMLLTFAAGGRFLSAVVGFIASPITSLNPTIGAGMVVGFVEAWLRKPTVEDAEKVSEVKTLRGVYGNNFTRTLLVAVMANMGSALGAWIGISWLIAILT